MRKQSQKRVFFLSIKAKNIFQQSLKIKYELVNVYNMGPLINPVNIHIREFEIFEFFSFKEMAQIIGHSSQSSLF